MSGCKFECSVKHYFTKATFKAYFTWVSLVFAIIEYVQISE